jgi:hypothetical protein
MNGVIVGEQQDSRELFVLWVKHNDVSKEILRRGDPVLPWEPGYQGLDDRPWLAGERPWRSSWTSHRPSSKWHLRPNQPGEVASARRLNLIMCVLCVYGADEHLPAR